MPGVRAGGVGCQHPQADVLGGVQRGDLPQHGAHNPLGGLPGAGDAEDAELGERHRAGDVDGLGPPRGRVRALGETLVCEGEVHVPTRTSSMSGSPRRRSQRRVDGVAATVSSSALSGRAQRLRRCSSPTAAAAAVSTRSAAAACSASRAAYERLPVNRSETALASISNGVISVNTSIDGLKSTARMAPAGSGASIATHGSRPRAGGSGRAAA